MSDACPGAWRRHEAADGALARFRPVGGAVSAAELRVLAGAAALGGSPLEVTSRGSLQVRALAPQTADDLAGALRGLGGAASLLDGQGRDVPCGVVASPRSGALDAAAVTIADALRGRTDVPGRLLVALDDGTGDVSGQAADVTVVLIGGPDASDPDTSGLDTSGPDAAGPDADAGTAGPDAAGPSAVAGHPTGTAALLLAGIDTGLRHPDPAALALAAVEAFLAVRDGAWRVAELADVAPVTAGVAARLPVTRTTPDVAAGPADPTRLGIDAGRDGVLEVLPRLGELEPRTAGVLVGLLDGTELRVTPWRTLVLRGLADPVDALARLDGLVESGPSRWAGLSACVGAPRCAKSHTDVRGDLARAVATGRAGGLLRAHWVGCHRACGTPGGRVAVVEGTPTGAYRTVVRAGRVST